MPALLLQWSVANSKKIGVGDTGLSCFPLSPFPVDCKHSHNTAWAHLSVRSWIFLRWAQTNNLPQHIVASALLHNFTAGITAVNDYKSVNPGTPSIVSYHLTVIEVLGPVQLDPCKLLCWSASYFLCWQGRQRPDARGNSLKFTWYPPASNLVNIAFCCDFV